MAFSQKLASYMHYYAGHPHAIRYLAASSFIEAIFFPLPPDAMLIPMVLEKPELKYRYALVTTLTSVLGGLIGYLIGVYFFENFALPVLTQMGYQSVFETAHQWFKDWGFWAMLLAGITPIPFKVFTIAAGVSQMFLFPFIISCMIGRALRFYGVACVVAWGGPKVIPVLNKYAKFFGWGLIAVALLIFILLK